MENSTSSKWIALDGIDAVGKSTQLRKISALMEDSGLSVVQLQEFSDSDLGDMIRGVIKQRRFFALSEDGNTPMANMLTLLADLVYKIEKQQNGSFQDADISLSDRGILSLLAYESVKIQRSTRTSIEDILTRFSGILQLATEKLPTPDLHIVYRADIEEVAKRVVARGESPLDANKISFLSSIQDVLMQPHDVFSSSVIDVTNLTEDQVTTDTLEIIRSRFSIAI